MVRLDNGLPKRAREEIEDSRIPESNRCWACEESAEYVIRGKIERRRTIMVPACEDHVDVEPSFGYSPDPGVVSGVPNLTPADEIAGESNCQICGSSYHDDDYFIGEKDCEDLDHKKCPCGNIYPKSAGTCPECGKKCWHADYLSEIWGDNGSNVMSPACEAMGAKDADSSDVGSVDLEDSDVNYKDLDSSDLTLHELPEFTDLESKSSYALGVIYRLAKDSHNYVTAGSLPDTNLSDSTEYRVREDLKEEGLISQNKKGWQLTSEGLKLVRLLAKAVELKQKRGEDF